MGPSGIELYRVFRMTFVFAIVLLLEVAHPSNGDLATAVIGGQQEQSATTADTPGGLRQVSNEGPPTESARLAYLMGIVRRFHGFAANSRNGVSQRHLGEDLRLRAAMNTTSDMPTRLALLQSLDGNNRSLVSTNRVYDNMLKFASTLENVIGAASSRGMGCEDLMCAEHGSCTDTTAGAQCICNEGFVGDGTLSCRAPPEFAPHRLLHEGMNGISSRAADMHVCVFANNKVAVVWRDVMRGEVGRIVIGRVREAGKADLAPPEQFTTAGEKAFDPVCTGFPNGRLAIAWRDKNRGATAWIRGGALGQTNVRGANWHITWGEPYSVSTNQAHKMALLSMPNSRAVLLFSDKTVHAPIESFGNSLLAEIGDRGSITGMGTFRFSDYAVLRLESVRLTSTSFVIAVRGARATDDMDPSSDVTQEANAIFGVLVDGDLAFDPNHLRLEPSQTQIWARGISLIAPNTFAYAYQTGQALKTKMAVVVVDPESHQMRIRDGPYVIHSGFSPYVSALSVPYTASDPHTLVYYDGGNRSAVNLCSWKAVEGKLDRCQDFTWMPEKVQTLSGVHLGGGKSFMVFATDSGVPYYSVFGLSKA